MGEGEWGKEREAMELRPAELWLKRMRKTMMAKWVIFQSPCLLPDLRAETYARKEVFRENEE